MNHAGFVNEWLLMTQVVSYAAGTAIVILLALLVHRAARFDDPGAYQLLLWGCLLWNTGNLVASVGVVAGLSIAGTFFQTVMAVAFSGAALSPAGALIMWQRWDRRSTDARPIGTWLVRVALLVGISLTLLMWDHVLREHAILSHQALWPLLGYHVAAFFIVGALVFYRGHVTTLAGRVAIRMTALGALGTGGTVLLQKSLMVVDAGSATAVLLEIVRQMTIHVMTLGALFFFARFRFADVFIRQSLRITAAAVLGVLTATLLESSTLVIADVLRVQARAVWLTGAAVFIALLVSSFMLIDRLIIIVVDRWLFRQPDYAAALRRLRDTLSTMHHEPALNDATAHLVRGTLAVPDARVVLQAELTHSLREGLSARDVVDGTASGRRSASADQPLAVLVAIRSQGRVSGALVVTPRLDHPTFLAREVEFMLAAAVTLGQRLDLVGREREEIEQQTREAQLQQQLSEATLRALQAQVNPHFLFNTLNTIAHLIQVDPARAEQMTERLADVFSHVLTRSYRPFSSVREEMDFLRTYLTIEEARFGDRLRVAFSVDPSAARATIPSLILQPAVENALKHGLAPKIGPGHLTISAAVEGASLRLSVRDDGVGPAGGRTKRTASTNGSARTTPVDGATPRPGGLGLRNIAERLETLYADQASLQFEPGPEGGSVVTLKLPLDHHDQKPVD